MGRQRVVSPVLAAVAVMLRFAPTGVVSAQDLTGYCLDNREGGCQGRYLPFRGNTIDFCEETCTLTNPTQVRGLNAILYDFACLSDYPSSKAGRVMILQQTDHAGKTLTSLISKSDTKRIVRCP